MWGIIAAVLIVALIVAWVVGIFVYDSIRRKKGAPSLFVDVCEEEGRGKRLLRDYRKRYPKQH